MKSISQSLKMFKLDTLSYPKTHSHGTTETNTSSSDSDMNELSIENKSLVYGIGSKVDLDKFEIIAEYLNLHSTGDIEDAVYLIEHDTSVESIYVQLTSKNEKFNYGLRSEVFWYDKSLYGSGASIVTEEMGISPIKEKYLHTLDVNYKIDDKQKIFMDNSYSNYQTAIKFNYFFRFKLWWITKFLKNKKMSQKWVICYCIIFEIIEIIYKIFIYYFNF